MDNCSAHRGQKAADRFRAQWPNTILVHTPVHASWLNQVEIYFSIIQRKTLTPNDFASLAQLEQRLLAFQSPYEKSACPFRWSFTRKDLHSDPCSLIGKYVTVILNQTTKLPGSGLASPGTRWTGHCREGTGASMIASAIDGGS
jgi:hypothetical protein